MATGYNFTSSIRDVLREARAQAQRRHHAYVAPEHIVLAMLSQPDSGAFAVIAALPLDRSAVRQRLEETAMATPATEPALTDPRCTTPSTKALELAMTAAHDLSQDYIGTEHLLLGVVQEGTSKAAGVLTELGAGVGQIRDQLRAASGLDIA